VNEAKRLRTSSALDNSIRSTVLHVQSRCTSTCTRVLEYSAIQISSLMKPALKDKVEALLRCADDLKSSIAENPNDDNELESLVEKMATCLEDPSHVSPHRCNDKPYLDASTCAHAGIQRDISNAPLAPLLSFATTFEKTGVEGQFVYSRHENPTRKFLEQEIAKLESGCANSCCCAFSSGMMAASAIVLAHGLPLTVYLPEDCYHGVPVRSRLGLYA